MKKLMLKDRDNDGDTEISLKGNRDITLIIMTVIIVVMTILNFVLFFLKRA